MKLLANREIRRFFLALSSVPIGFALLFALLLWPLCGQNVWWLLLLYALMAGIILLIGVLYFRRQHAQLEAAVSAINAYLGGDVNARIECDEEGELYHLFHKINTLASILNAHADNEQREKEFLKNTISDISHQLKTPLAALNIYNGLLQEEAAGLPQIREFADLSEQELDRMETLVQNLLKITRLDAGAVVFGKTPVPLTELFREVERRFAWRAKQEEKTLIFSAEDGAELLCDSSWMAEALGNLVKNALDHTGPGDAVCLRGHRLPASVQIEIRDTGSGIAPQDLPHIFKRFYRSRFSQNTPGIGLGLPLAKAIIEAHGGTVEVDSTPGHGTVFTIHFRIPTKL